MTDTSEYLNSGAALVLVDLSNKPNDVRMTPEGEPFLGAEPTGQVETGFASLPVETLSSNLPTWLRVNTNDDPSTTIYHKVFHALSDALSDVVTLSMLVGGEMQLQQSSFSYPRTIWRCKVSSDFLRKQSVVTITAPGLGSPVNPRQVYSQQTLLFANDPVFTISEDGCLYFRNLAQKAVSLASDTGEYVITGDAPVPDECIWISTGDNWERLNSDTLTLKLGVPGIVEVKYATSRMVDAVTALGTVTVNGSPASKLTLHDVWNVFDEEALMVSLTRNTNEDNPSVTTRVKTAYRLTQVEKKDLADAMIGHELGLVGLLPWNGVDTVDLTSVGLTNVTMLTVIDLPRIRNSREETLVSDPEARTYTSASGEWLEGKVFVNNTRVTAKSYPGMTMTRGMVDFKTPVYGQVTASYSCEIYSVSVDNDMGVAVIQPNANTPIGNYTILYVRDIVSTMSTDPKMVKRMVGEDGLPTDLYLAVSRTIANSSPVLVGSTTWGNDAHWFDDIEETPQLTHLPVIIR